MTPLASGTRPRSKRIRQGKADTKEQQTTFFSPVEAGRLKMNGWRKWDVLWWYRALWGNSPWFRRERYNLGKCWQERGGKQGGEEIFVRCPAVDDGLGQGPIRSSSLVLTPGHRALVEPRWSMHNVRGLVTFRRHLLILFHSSRKPRHALEHHLASLRILFSNARPICC
jgi:hypothetical protein